MNISGRYKFDEGEHLHELDGKPLTGTSSVMSVVAKPLTWWASGMAVATLGWTPKTEYVNGRPRALPKGPRVEATREKLAEITSIGNRDVPEEFLDLLDTAYAAHSKSLAKSATKGKDLHSALEKYVKYCIVKHEGKPAAVTAPDIQDFVNWAVENVEKFVWSELHTFSEKYWLGGITDAGATMKDGHTAIIDFKSSREAYVSQFLQIGGYSLQIKENGGFTREGEQMIEPVECDEFIIVPFGAKVFAPARKDDTPAFERGFLSALDLYRLTNTNE